MTYWTLIRRSLRFHARAHLGVVLGAATGSAVLVGALVVGDSVRGSLRDRALQRLDGIDLAMAAPDRFFRDSLRHALESSVRFAVSAPRSTISTNRPLPFRRYQGASVTAAVHLLATAARQDGSARA